MRSDDGSARFAATSPAQDGLWYLSELAPDAPAHTACRAYRVAGPLDVDALRAAWRSVLARHESLRCAVVDRDGRPQLLVSGVIGDSTWSLTDLTGDGAVRAGDPAAAARAFCAGLAAAALRPDAGPPARLAVARLGDDDHVVALLAHEIVCDDESLSVVVDELSAAYAADGAQPGPAPRYTEYARWQRDQDHGADLDWWRAELTPPPSAPDLPVDHPRPPTLWGPAGVLRFDWGSGVSDALAELAAAEGTEPRTVLLAAFHALLHRYSGGERLAVGMPVSVRPAGFADGVGLFENVVVPCADLTGAPTFRELLRRVDAAVVAALDHSALPFAELVRALELDRAPHRVPFCDALFAVVADDPGLRLAGARAAAIPVDPVVARADLALTVTASGATGALEYRADTFEAASAELVLDHLRTLVAAAVADPDAPVAALPLESRERLAAAVAAADRIADGPVGDATANALVHRIAERSPGAAALSTGGEHTSYAELRAAAARVTAALGRVAGEPVVVRMGSGPRQIAAVLGVLDAGAHLVCLGADEMGERGRAVLAEVLPARLVVDGGAGADALALWYAEELDGEVIDVAAAPEPAAATTPVPVTPADRAYVAYTSGSTGRPKGIPQSHATLAQFTGWFAAEFRIGPGARVAQWAAPGYDANLCEAFAALAAGATLCPVPDRTRANPEKLVDWLAAERITHFQTVPSFAREVLRVISGGAAPAHLTHLLLAGEALPGDLVEGLRAALPSVRLVNLYGPTELVLATWHEVAGDGPGQRVTPVGRSIPGRQVLVLDAAGEPCPAGVTGDIVVRSPFTTPGYLGAAAGERAAFAPIADPRGLGIGGACYRTGDLGRRRFDGAIEFRGRKDFQVKFNGIRLELGDIEAALANHDTVAECAVVAIAGANKMVTRLVAYVVPTRGDDGSAVGTAADWRAALRARFGKAMPPVTFRTLLGLPRNIGGKVDRRRLPEPDAARVDPEPRAQSWVEEDLAAIWSELGVYLESPDDPFFAAGGHSLLVPTMLHVVLTRFGVAVPIPEFLADPTLPGLAARVEAHFTPADPQAGRRRTGH